MSVKSRGQVILNMYIELLQTKSSDFRFNLLIVKIYYVRGSSVGVSVSNLFTFKEISCNKKDSLKRLDNGNFQFFVSLLHAQ